MSAQAHVWTSENKLLELRLDWAPVGPCLRKAGGEQAAGHSPLEAVALVQGAQGCIWILVVEVDRGSHEQEGGIGHVHTPAHLTVQLHHNGIPARRWCSGRLRQKLASALGL